jgi:sodium-coupled neutral amino acid transporter 11
MAFYPARDAIQKALGLDTAQKQPSNLQHYSLTVILFAVFLAMGVSLRSLGKVYSVVGGIASSFLAYIIPGYAYLKTFRPFSTSPASDPHPSELVPFAKPQNRSLDLEDLSPSWILSVCATILVLFGSMVMTLTAVGAFK